MRTSCLGVLATLLSMLAIGCGAGRGGGLLRTTVIDHPMTGGAAGVAAPMAFDDPESERHLGIPNGTLTDTASMVRADAQQVCFDITVRVPEQEQQWSRLSAYTLQVLSSTMTTPLEGASLQERGVGAAQYQGHRHESVPTGEMNTYCVSHDQYGGCTQFRTEPVMTTITVPAVWTVYEGGGVACFANAGVLTPSTTWLRLRVLDPRNPGGRRGVIRADRRVGLNYEWELAGAQSVAQTPTSG